MKVFCAGMESSGNNWVRSVLSQHPELEISGNSFPSCMKEDRHYPIPGERDAVVIIVRDRTCQQKSVERREFNAGNEGKFTEEENLICLEDLIQSTPRVVFVSYESALIFRQAYWSNIFSQLGVPDFAVNTEYLDGNAKYFAP